MKGALSALEVRALVRELSGLKGAKIAQIYDLGPSGLLLQFHKSRVGREIVRLHPPEAFYLAKEKPPVKAAPGSFVSLLRRHLSGKRLLGMVQHDFDRILKVSFGHHAEEYSLVLEFFGKGNAVLLDSQGTVLGALIERSFGSRSTKKGAPYAFPSSPRDPFSLSFDSFASLFSEGRSEVVKVLAIDCALGGAYAEQVCSDTGVDKLTSPKKVSPAEKKRLFAAVRGLQDRYEPCVVLRDFEVADFLLFPLHSYEGAQFSPCSSLCEAQDRFFSLFRPRKKPSVRRQKLETIIADQKRQLAALEERAAQSQQKAELLYFRYADVREILEGIRACAKEKGWAAAKERFLHHPSVRRIDEKKGVVELEFPDGSG